MNERIFGRTIDEFPAAVRAPAANERWIYNSVSSDNALLRSGTKCRSRFRFVCDFNARAKRVAACCDLAQFMSDLREHVQMSRMPHMLNELRDGRISDFSIFKLGRRFKQSRVIIKHGDL